MKRYIVIRVMVILCMVGGVFQSQVPAPVLAVPLLRVQVYQHGDFDLIGNSFGYDCAYNTPLPVVGTVGACGTSTYDSAPDIFWRANYPSIGQATANSSITNTQASSSAVLNLPQGAEVTHAYLYWSATLAASGSDITATLARVGTDAFSETVTSLDSMIGPNNSYRSVADVTGLVQEHGSGSYQVSDVDILNWNSLINDNVFAGWWMVVFYKLSSAPFRQLTLYDGLDVVPVVLRKTSHFLTFWYPLWVPIRSWAL